MPRRIFTGTLRDADGTPLASTNFQMQLLDTFAVVGEGSYLAAATDLQTDADGEFTFPDGLPVPSAGSVRYGLVVGRDRRLILAIGDGAATTLEEQIVLGNTLPDLSALAQHAALRGDEGGIYGHVAPDGTTITSNNGLLTAISSAPSGAAGGVLSGTYPNPGFASDMATQAELDAHTNLTTSAHGGIAAAVHTHAAADLVSGVVDQARLPTPAASLLGIVPPVTRRAVPSGGSELFVIPGAAKIESITTLSIAANRITYCPFVVERRLRVTAMQIALTTVVASSLVRLGIVQLGETSQPVARILDAGEADGGSTADQAITGLSTVLEPGYYATAILNNAALAFRAFVVPIPWILPTGWNGSTLLLPAALQASHTYSTIPATPPAWTTISGASSGLRHLVGYQVDLL